VGVHFPFRRVVVRWGLVVATAFQTGVSAAAAEPEAPIPQGWKLVYEQHFDSPESLKEFAMTDPGAWRHADDGKTFALELAQQSRYQPPVRSPVNIAVIADRVFGDFILEADMVQTGREYGHRDMCVFFGIQDPSNFYYVHMATRADDHAHNVFIVRDAPRVKIATKTTEGVNWGLDVWHKVRVERRATEGVIQVYFDDMSEPIMTAEDTSFGAGWIGFGSFDDTGKVDNIRIWAPDSAERKTISFFTRSR
jgi:hypothetical protein